MWLGHTWDAALVLGGEEVKDACVRTFDVLSSRHAHDVTGVKP